MAIQTAIGLILDIIGVVLIAIPDASFLSSQFESGLLAEARERMAVYGGVHEDDPGFQELIFILEKIEPVAKWGSENGDCGDEYVEITADKRTGMQTPETSEHEQFDWGDTYVEARYSGGDSQWNEIDFYDVGAVYDAIRERVSPEETNFRYWGLTVLITGFLFQLMESLNISVWIGVFLAIGVVTGALYVHHR